MACWGCAVADVSLIYPAWWADYPASMRDAVMNGCGPSGWKARYIPDTIWGVCVSRACDIHDVEYTWGTSRAAADARLFANICLTLAAHGGLLMPVRIVRAFVMFSAVRAFGGKFFKGGGR